MKFKGLRVQPLYLSKISLWRALAYTTNRLWITFVFLGPMLFDLYPIEIRWSIAGDIFLASLISNIVSLAVLGCFHKLILKLFCSKYGVWAGPVIAGLGILLIAPDLTSGVVPEISSIILSSIGIGSGSALVLLDVGRSYSLARRHECAFEVLCATALAAIIALLLHCMPFRLALGFILLTPFLTVLCVKKTQAPIHAEPSKYPTREEKLPMKIIVRLFLAAFILGSITNFMHEAYSHNNAAPFGVEFSLSVSIGNLATALIIGLNIVLSKSFSLGTLNKSALLFCLIGYVVLPIISFDGSMPFLIVSIGFTVYEILVWIFLSELANRFQYTPTQMFGFGWALVLTVRLIASFLVSKILMSINVLDVETLPIISAVATTMIFFTLIYILPDRVLETFEAGFDNQAFSKDSGDPASLRKDIENTKLPMLARCQIIGEFYNLTPREIDVFRLLAAGRNAARIQKELFISKGTVNTHLRHIHQKLGVHSQQELIDLIQGADLDNIQQTLQKRPSSQKQAGTAVSP